MLKSQSNLKTQYITSYNIDFLLKIIRTMNLKHTSKSLVRAGPAVPDPPGEHTDAPDHIAVPSAVSKVVEDTETCHRVAGHPAVAIVVPVRGPTEQQHALCPVPATGRPQRHNDDEGRYGRHHR